MKVKCYGLYQGEKEMFCNFANPSQRDFLDFELKTALKRLKKSQKIEFENGPNGVWYCRQHPELKTLTQLMLLEKDSASMSIAANFFNQAVQIQRVHQISKEKEKMRMKIIDLIKIFNSNQKVEKLNSNVMELEGIIKGNIGKLTTNMNELDSAERKSSMMAELSMQFERDSKALEKKMKRRKLLMKIFIAALISMVLGVVIYILFF